jgi:hypothetical protein
MTEERVSHLVIAQVAPLTLQRSPGNRAQADRRARRCSTPGDLSHGDQPHAAGLLPGSEHLPAVKAEVERQLTISRTQLGSDLLMIGAAELAFESILSDPASARSVLLGG